jgi:hypothetical protein
MLGLKKQKFYAAYGYSYNINESQALNSSGTHLLTLGIDFVHSKNARWK